MASFLVLNFAVNQNGLIWKALFEQFGYYCCCKTAVWLYTFSPMFSSVPKRAKIHQYWVSVKKGSFQTSMDWTKTRLTLRFRSLLHANNPDEVSCVAGYKLSFVCSHQPKYVLIGNRWRQRTRMTPSKNPWAVWCQLNTSAVWVQSQFRTCLDSTVIYLLKKYERFALLCWPTG